jgi:hypothetical protein
MRKPEAIPVCPFCGYDLPEFVGISQVAHFSFKEKIYKCPACITHFRKIDGRPCVECNDDLRAYRFAKARINRGEPFSTILEQVSIRHRPTRWLGEILEKSA